MSAVPIRVKGLHKVFQKGGQRLHVLRGVDLELTPGERVAVLGQSGSGKSTFLHLLGTLDHPSEGQIWFDGNDIFALPTHQIDALRNKHIGFVFQFHHLLPDQDAVQNVMMPLLISGLDAGKARKKARDLLARVGLEDRFGHRPGELSGGEQQRVAIARALVQEPGLLLADEPTGNLDPITAQNVFQLLLELNQELGSTLLVVTHSHQLAEEFERRLHLREGRFVNLEETQSGEPPISSTTGTEVAGP